MADGGALLFHTRQDQRRSVRSALAHMPTRFERRRPPPSHFLSAGHTTTTVLDAKRHTDHCEGWKKEGWRRDGAEKQTPARNEVSQKAHELKLTPVCTVGAQAQSWDLNIWATLVPFDDFFKFSVTSWLFMPRPKHFDTVWLVKLLKTQRSSVIWINLIPDWDIPLGYTVMF